MWKNSNKDTGHRGLIRLSRKSINLQTKHLSQLSIPTTEHGTELVRRLLLPQFCMVCFQNLRGALSAFRIGDNYIPNVLCRNVIEYFITWTYINKNPEMRVQQFIDAPLKNQLRFSEIVETITKTQPDLLDIDPERIKERSTELKDEIDARFEKHGAWNKILEQRAGDVGLENAYNMPYRLLSTITHPDALQGEDYFIEAADGTVTICEFRDSGSNAPRSIGTGFRLVNEMFSQLADIFHLPNQDQYQIINQEIENIMRSMAAST